MNLSSITASAVGRGVLLMSLTLAAGMSWAAPVLLAAGLEGASGSTLGPGGALYVTEGAAGRVSRVDPQSGAVTPFASGLPPSLVGIGGATDVVFIGSTAYVLVTLVGPDVGGSDVVGVYRIDGPGTHTIIADIGAYSINNPPDTAYFLPTGVQYALEHYRGGFLVTDGHHNRVLRVELNGQISEFRAFDNIVPTGLAVSGNTVFMAQAGPVPHLPEDGRVVAFGPRSAGVDVVAQGAPLLVDVEFGRGRSLYALAQGDWDGVTDGSPALEDTGSLVQVMSGGQFQVLATELDRPTSMQFIGNTAYIVTLGGEIWRIDDVSAPPFGTAR